MIWLLSTTYSVDCERRRLWRERRPKGESCRGKLPYRVIALVSRRATPPLRVLAWQARVAALSNRVAPYVSTQVPPRDAISWRPAVGKSELLKQP